MLARTRVVTRCAKLVKPLAAVPSTTVRGYHPRSSGIHAHIGLGGVIVRQMSTEIPLPLTTPPEADVFADEEDKLFISEQAQPKTKFR